MAVDHREALTALDRAYAGIEAAVADLTPTGLLTRTRCHGWLVVDLLFYLLVDAQRRLVALASPAPGPADRDHVSYWTGFAAEANDPAPAAWWIRRSASAFGDGAGVVALWRASTMEPLLERWHRGGCTERTRFVPCYGIDPL
jgi:hypothetical protein